MKPKVKAFIESSQGKVSIILLDFCIESKIESSKSPFETEFDDISCSTCVILRYLWLIPPSSSFWYLRELSRWVHPFPTCLLRTPTLLTPWNEAYHPSLSDPYKTRRSPIGDCPCPERCPQHIGLLVSMHPHRGANFMRLTLRRLGANFRPRKQNGGSTSPSMHPSMVMHAQNL